MADAKQLNMVPFVSVDHMIKLVMTIGIERFLRELAHEIERDFLRFDEFDKRARIASHSHEGVIELMPTADDRFYSFKYVNGHPQNRKIGRQTVTAFGVLAEVESGYPVLVSEMTVLTALRTAATSALVASYLARKNSHTMALIGNGAQAEFQAIAFKALCGIQRLRLYDIDPEASHKCLRNLQGLGFDITLCQSSEQAVEGADIVTTVTADKQMAAILSDNMVAQGMHLNAVGGDCPGKTELARDILLKSDVFVEYPPQTRVEGEIQQMPEDFPVTEIWNVMNGKSPGRKAETQITLFDSVGFATEDFSALRYVLSKLAETGHYSELDLLADPDDPRDLYGMLLRSVR